jgi:hypothetical protein
MRFADGVPVKESTVNFEPENKEMYDSISTRTDEQGRFTLKIPFEAAGPITGEKYFWKNDYASCTQIVAALGTSGSSPLRSVPLVVTGTEPLSNATVRFPFDFCEKKSRTN